MKQLEPMKLLHVDLHKRTFTYIGIYVGVYGITIFKAATLNSITRTIVA